MNKLTDFLIRAEHKLYITGKRMRLRNKSMTIFSSNCNGAYMLHDLGCRFNTPTVNLFFLPDHYLKFVKNPSYYLSQTLVEVTNAGVPYPVGQLGDILLFFMHYASFAEAKKKWEERSKRVDLDNVILVMTDKDGCEYRHIQEFDALPYKDKVIFTHKEYPEFSSAFYIPGFEEKGEVGILSDWKPQFWRRRWLDDFDYVSLLNAAIK